MQNRIASALIGVISLIPFYYNIFMVNIPYSQ